MMSPDDVHHLIENVFPNKATASSDVLEIALVKVKVLSK
jgi:hypothetical protein